MTLERVESDPSFEITCDNCGDSATGTLTRLREAGWHQLSTDRVVELCDTCYRDDELDEA